jgi:CubicO group peptidase (beta-lactamase class C family)
MERVSAQELAGLVQEARERRAVPGLVAGILRNGELTIAADGVLELGRDDAVSPSTIFRIASITKPLVATLAMTLVQDGLLSLDKPPQGSQVGATVRQLLSHQGGIALEWPQPLDPGERGDDALLRIAAGEPELLSVGPGELFSYSNVGFWLVGAAVARACGSTFEEAMQARVLDPLGLSSTGFEPEGAARGHNQVEPGADEHRPVEDKYPRVRRPSGGLWSSVEDLLRFAGHHLGGPGPLTSESVAEMQRPEISTAGYQCGLGWFLSEPGGLRIVAHGGSAARYQSSLLLVPARRVALAAVSNSSRGAAAIRDVREQLGLVPELPDVPLSPAELDAFVGRYVGQGIEVDVVTGDGHLRVEVSEFDPFTGQTSVNPSVRARPIGEGTFEITEGDWRGERFNFPREEFVCLGVLAQRV